MRFNRYITLLALCFLSIYMNVQADDGICSNAELKELSSLAYNVKVAYDVEDKSEYKELIAEDNSTTYKIPNYDFTITVYNLSESIYAIIEDETFYTSELITYEDTNNGTYPFKDSDFGRVHKYTITIHANTEDCYGRQIRTITLTRPKYNGYSEFAYCNNSSIYYCQRFITNDLNIEDAEDFLQKIYKNNQVNNLKDKNDDEIKNIIMDNWILYASIFFAIAFAFAGFVIIKKKKNKTGGWKL